MLEGKEGGDRGGKGGVGSVRSLEVENRVIGVFCDPSRACKKCSV